MQVYRGLDIGTAKPSLAERTQIPHHLIDVVDLHQTFDAQQFSTQANAISAQLLDQSKTPIFCGGTGLYFRAFIDGFDAFPSSDPELRHALEQQPIEDLLRELEHSDPQWYDQIDRHNPRRIIRAIEIIRLTGKPVSAQRTTWNQADATNRPPLIVLTRAPETLRDRIETRVDEMFQSGLVEETNSLLHQGLRNNETARHALGYRQVIEHLEGVRSLDETIGLVKTKTWQFARRQLTWFRKQSNTQWVDLDQCSPGEQVDRILAINHP